MAPSIKYEMDEGKFQQVLALCRKANPDITESDVIGVIYYDWPNWNEHVFWLKRSSVEDISKWVASVLEDTPTMKED